MTFNWTDEIIERAFSLQRDGKSTAQIASILGTTKNSVIGKLNRTRIARGEKPARPSDVNRNERRRRTKMLTLATRAESVSRFVSLPIPAPDEGQLASIVDVTGCKWPVRDDAGFVGGVAFCNHATNGGVYCAHHHAKATMKVKARVAVLPVGLRFGRRAA